MGLMMVETWQALIDLNSGIETCFGRLASQPHLSPASKSRGPRSGPLDAASSNQREPLPAGIGTIIGEGPIMAGPES